MLANAIAAQMLPEGVVKGGTSLKLRFGDAVTRYTNDLDTARASSVEEYISAFQSRLTAGWEGFTGRIVPVEPAAPPRVPHEYIMLPFEIKLSYLGKSWLTVKLEVGHNEIGDAQDSDLVIPEEASALLREFGFPSLQAVPVMRLSHQIAQKLHALSAPGSSRIHDLIDLQIIVNSSQVIDYGEVRRICERLFAYRQMQSWPPLIQSQKHWDESYPDISSGLGVLPFTEAVEWVNQFIRRISNARE